YRKAALRPRLGEYPPLAGYSEHAPRLARKYRFRWGWRLNVAALEASFLRRRRCPERLCRATVRAESPRGARAMAIDRHHQRRAHARSIDRRRNFEPGGDQSWHCCWRECSTTRIVGTNRHFPDTIRS